MTESKPQRWRHLKRGSTYTEIARGDLQSTHPLLEGKTLVAYRSEHDGRVWFRPQAEFEDGRFERLPNPPDPSTERKPQWSWQSMDSAPKDRKIIVYAPGAEWGLPDIVCFCEWDRGAGFCVDELRYPTMWQEQPGASPDSSPIPPERVPEALRELAILRRRMYSLRDRLPDAYADACDRGACQLEFLAARLEVGEAK